ncbi:suppressor of fused domain protein [Frankia sp. AiPa1]|uniref:suppressor of fused domain protein n=1 Tax=Frankia sp. AiPa1 TaxID=573492 RepID=UPI00202B5EED|nr:suppressor of fused domain protein [Frankia sp. AiPa1]MCL9758361.1 suppressor of fused domain protein [Frankia sp. AiPa1]
MSDSAHSELVERHVAEVFGPDTGRAAVTFLGTEQIEVLRYGPDRAGLVRYLTLGMSREPMTAAASAVRDPAGPRAELVLSLRGRRDSVLRRLAVLAAIPIVEGRPITAGAALELGEPLWDGAGFTAVLVAEPGGLLPDLPLTPPGGTAGSQAIGAADDVLAALGNSLDGSGDGDPHLAVAAPIRFLPVLPMTANEAAYKRVHGPDALRQRWLAAGTDLRDPTRREVSLA